MAKLIYSAIASLDGYVEDKHGGFASLAPDDEVHAFINVLERPIGTYLYPHAINMGPHGITRTSGAAPTRSCTRGRSPSR